MTYDEVYAQAYFTLNPSAIFAFDQEREWVLRAAGKWLESIFKHQWLGSIELDGDAFDDVLSAVHPSLPNEVKRLRPMSGSKLRQSIGKIFSEVGLGAAKMSDFQDMMTSAISLLDTDDQFEAVEYFIASAYSVMGPSVKGYLVIVEAMEAWLDKVLEHPLQEILEE